MDALPSSIEAYLQEAGFSGTELIVLNKLLQEDALTLRELAAKTGKSTGVLDQAVKKLIKKHILSKELINETPKYVLQSLQSIVRWMEDDIAVKQEMLKRRHENFETFVRSLTVGKKRPEMEYFEGTEGIKKAYIQLLDRGNDIVQYGPTNFAAPEDPLREFWVQYFRERRSRGIFARVITHNKPLGRKFQSRDPFEYRKTILVDEDAYPFTFEKIVIGDTVACFQLEDERACFIKFPELAQNERHFFERIWNKKISNEQTSDADSEAYKQSVQPEKATVPFQTKTLSQLREFFLSKKSIATFAIFGLLAGAMTYGLYRQNLNLNYVRVQEKVKSIAATAALQFDANDINSIKTSSDINKPAYKKVIYQLNEIRRQNKDVAFAFIFRPNVSTNEWEFVADADSLDPYAQKDLNNDGVINEADHLSPPGETTHASQTFITSYFNAKPSYEDNPYNSQWGTLITGSAPILDSLGNPVAVLGIDIKFSDLYSLTSNSFTPLGWFVGFFLLFIIIRLAAFNRSLFQELCEICKVKKILIIASVSGAIAITATFILYQYTNQLTLKRMQEKVHTIAVTAAPQFSANDLEALQEKEDWKKPEWTKVGNQLNKIKHDNDLLYAYIIRKSSNDNSTMEFAADGDSLNPYANTDNDPSNDVDMNDDGIIDGSPTGGDYQSWPGQPYPTAPQEAFDAYNGPLTTAEFYEDQWGKVITGYAPIKNKEGEIIAIFAADLKADVQNSITNEVFAPIHVFLIFFGLFLIFRIKTFKSSLLHKIILSLFRRKIIYALLFILIGVYWTLFGLHFYVKHVEIEQDGKRLMAIAATAAPTINGEDLALLQKAGDMQKPEYQRIWKQLNDIRTRNGDITYVYIMRATDQPDIYEFVVDADSNYFVPFKGIDYTQDDIIDETDENVAPGVRYYWKDFEEERWHQPYVSIGFVDQWGIFLSGSAPIKDAKANTVAILAVDVARMK